MSSYQFFKNLYNLLQMETLNEIINKLGADPYQILNTNPHQDLLQLRKNYRHLAFKYHPDKNKSDQAKQMFLKINIAFQYLQKQENRQIYRQHIKALEMKKKRHEAMDEKRKKMANDLKNKQQQHFQAQQTFEAELKRRKEFFEKKMKEQEERENLKQQIYEGMGTSKYYEEVSSIKAQWQTGLSFTSQLLILAFSDFGTVKSVFLQGKNAAKVVFNSIDDCTRTVETFAHPLMRITFYIERSKRQQLLKALKTQESKKIDLSLNSETISRFKQIINRTSTLYSQ